MIKDNNVVDTLRDDIKQLEIEYINTLINPEDIYKTQTITGLFHYIYENYIGDLLNNKTYVSGNRYNDIGLLDRLFGIYIDICYKYNNIPTILEYSIFTGVSRDIIHDWKTGNRRNVNPDYVHTVKRWYNVCESAQVKDTGVKSIFLLKAVYNYNDEHIAQENILNGSTVEKLPDLGKIQLEDKNVVQIAQPENASETT